MTTVTQSGITVEEAIEKALQQLDVSRKDVEIEVLTQGRKGFLGIGAREAEVKVMVKKEPEPKLEQSQVQAQQQVAEPIEEQTEKEEVEQEIQIEQDEIKEPTQVEEIIVERDEENNDVDPIQESITYLTNVAKEMHIDDLDVSYEADGKYIYFQLESDKAALLIGKRGQTLNALQQLTQLVANQYAERFKVVRLNVGDYRERRRQSLTQLSERMADKAVHTNRKVQLEPMPAYERKVIHHALSSRLDIETYSEGTDPHRYLVIEPIR